MAKTNGTIHAGPLEALKAKGSIVVTHGSVPIVVFYNEGDVRAVDNRCPHMGFPLHRGTVQDGILTCHWHHARFDLQSGCTFDLWADDAKAYPVEVREGEIYVRTEGGVHDPTEHGHRRLREGMEQNDRAFLWRPSVTVLWFDRWVRIRRSRLPSTFAGPSCRALRFF